MKPNLNIRVEIKMWQFDTKMKLHKVANNPTAATTLPSRNSISMFSGNRLVFSIGIVKEHCPTSLFSS